MLDGEVRRDFANFHGDKMGRKRGLYRRFQRQNYM